MFWYILLCGCFFGSSYAIHKGQENKRLKAQLLAMEEPIERQFINIAA